MVLSIVLSAVVLGWFLLCRKTIFSVTFDETFAGAAGVNTDIFGVILAVLTGITIVVGMKMMGSIMISALIIFPALTSMRLTKSFGTTVGLAAGISVVCFLAGFFAACIFSLQTGAAVVTAELVCFALVCGVTEIISKVRIRRRGKQ
jgi:zinc transport system permease protein